MEYEERIQDGEGRHRYGGLTPNGYQMKWKGIQYVGRRNGYLRRRVKCIR